MRRVVVIVLALLVLVPTAVQAAVWYRCAHDGEVRKACCCPAKTDRDDTSEQERSDEQRNAPPTIGVETCCEITTVEAPAPAARESAPPAGTVSPLPVVEAVAWIAPPAPPTVQLVASDWLPPARPPAPVFVRNCALLL